VSSLPRQEENSMNAIHPFRPLLGALLAALIAAPMVAAAQTADEPHAQRQAKQALDDRADPHMPVDNVGQGTHFARKPLGEGAYFGDANRAAVHKYYAALAGKSCPAGAASTGDCVPAQAKLPWRIGQALPAGALVQPVPKALRPSLPKLPPGLKYVAVGSDILLVANGSKMVVDGIDGVARR
jgi:Ni/Co efflux regulator RcnB